MRIFSVKEVGYIANSVNTVANGTSSGGRIYDNVKKKFYVRVIFTTYSHIICKIVENTEEVRKEYLKQGEKFVEREFD